MNKLAHDRGLPRYCYGFIPTSKEEIRIDIAESGYTPVGRDGSMKHVLEMNRELGVTRPQMEAMKVGSMFGWGVPGADPQSYDEYGAAIRKKHMDRDDR